MFIFYEFRHFFIDNARVIYRKIRYIRRIGTFVTWGTGADIITQKMYRINKYTKSDDLCNKLRPRIQWDVSVRVDFCETRLSINPHSVTRDIKVMLERKKTDFLTNTTVETTL